MPVGSSNVSIGRQLKRLVEYDHQRDLPGSPSITDVFWQAWNKAYGHGQIAGVWFEFNGMRIEIKRIGALVKGRDKK